MKSKFLTPVLLLVFGAILTTSSCRKFETDDLFDPDPINADTPVDGDNRTNFVPVLQKDIQTDQKSK